MFNFSKSLDCAVPQFTHQKAGTGTYKVGMALKIAANKLAAATGSDVVQYICAEEKTLAADGDLLCFAVTENMIFECPIEDYDATYHGVGLRSAIHSDSLQITDAVAGSGRYASNAAGSYTSAALIPTRGGAYIVDMLGASADGDTCLVRLNYMQ